MYSVSDNYKIAVADSHRKSKMRAVLTVGNTVINIDDSDIIKDTVYVTNQCTNGNEYEYGCVYASECGITIKSNVDRYGLYDAKLELYWSLWTGAEWEEIPLGVFFVSEPSRVNDKIKIKALDGMTKLDVYVTEDTTGTMPELMAYIAEKCGVELSQTTDELLSFVNASVQLSVQADKIDSYRDLLAYLGMVTASFAIFDRYGKLKLVKYATEPCVTLDKKHRFTNATFSDYTTSFAGIKARFIAEENYAPYEENISDDGLVLDMGDIPIVRGLPETKHEVLKAVLNILKDVRYTPFTIETLGNPALDLGDYVKNIGVGREGNTYLSPVTYSYWTYRGKHKLKAVGGNPKLAKVTKYRDKYTNSLESSIDTKTVVVKEYSNAGDIEFSTKDTEIATLNFATTESYKPIMLLCVRLSVDRDGLLVLQFYNDGVLDAERTYKQYIERGEHIVTIADVYDMASNERRTVNVLAHMEYFESDTRKQDAEIKTQNNFLSAIEKTAPTVADNVVVFPAYDKGVIDETVATATIKAGCVNMVLYGQGVAGEGKWDGTINFTEEVSEFLFNGGLAFAKITDAVASKLYTPTPIVFTASIGNASFSGGLTFAGATESIVFGKIIHDYVFNTNYAYNYTYDKYITTNNDMFALKTIYKYESTEQTIDSGKMCSVALDYTGLNVESVVVE